MCIQSKIADIIQNLKPTLLKKSHDELIDLCYCYESSFDDFHTKPEDLTTEELRGFIISLAILQHYTIFIHGES